MAFTRRETLSLTGTFLTTLAAPLVFAGEAVAAGPFSRPTLPFETDGLEPHISRLAVEVHSAVIHQDYVDRLNLLVEGTPYAQMTLEEIITAAHEDVAIDTFHAASEVYAHNHYFEAFGGGLTPMGPVLEEAMAREFGGLEGFVDEAIASADTLLGGGWLWLTAEGDGLFLEAFDVTGSPVGSGRQVLLAIDVAEHAYFLDYQADRAGYVRTMLTELVNWMAIEQRYIDG